MNNEKLTSKQYDFAMNYIKNGFNAYQAALSAGYTEAYSRTGSPNLVQNQSIQRLIKKEVTSLEDRIGITIEWKAKKLQRIIDSIVPSEGEIDKPYLKDAIRALSELNKMSGHYAPTKNVLLNVDTANRLIDVKKAYEDY